MINYVNSGLEVYGIPESQRTNYNFLLYKERFYEL